MHQGVAEIGVFDHAGQTRVVMVGKPRSLLGVVG